MTTAGEAVVDPDAVVVGGEAIVGGVGAGTGVVVVPGAPSGVTREDLAELAAFVSTVNANALGAIEAIVALANRPRDHQHTQSIPSAAWQVWHRLGFRPTFTAYLPDGTPIAHAGVTHPIPGELMEVLWGVPFTGYGHAS